MHPHFSSRSTFLPFFFERRGGATERENGVGIIDGTLLVCVGGKCVGLILFEIVGILFQNFSHDSNSKT
jgi:hypothetical protein